MTSTKQWLRQSRLTVETNLSDSTAQAPDSVIDLSEMRFRFRIHRGTIQTPNHADIRIYNLSDATAATLYQSVTHIAPDAPRRTVTIQAGYQGAQMGVIFRGEIVQVRRGRESQVDTYTDILAYDGDKAYVNGFISFTLAAGSTVRDRIKAIANALKPYGVSFDEAELPANLPEAALPRGVSFHGMGHEALRELGLGAGFSWSIQGGRLQVIRHGEALPGTAVVLSSTTGLIGLPEQTPGGIMARCLINPDIVPGRAIRIDQQSIQQQRYDLGYSPNAIASNAFRPSIAADGIYHVLAVDYEGDTRGEAWYQILTALTPGELPPSTLGILPA